MRSSRVTLPRGFVRRLSETHHDLVDDADDIRGRLVVETGGARCGRVRELYVDDRDYRVRFVEVERRGRLGVGRQVVFVPVEAISAVFSDRVIVDVGRSRSQHALVYDPVLMEAEAFSRVYGRSRRYGSHPRWDPGYVYPGSFSHR